MWAAHASNPSTVEVEEAGGLRVQDHFQVYKSLRLPGIYETHFICLFILFIYILFVKIGSLL